MSLFAALLFTGLLVAPGVVDAQRVDASADSDVSAHMDVEAVVTVSPRGPVTVRFPSSPDASPPRQPQEARTATRLSCAGNTAHSVRVRLVSSSGPSPADRAGELEWSADGGGSWEPLQDRTAWVVDEAQAGRHDECATVRFRWIPRDEGVPSSPPDEISVVFEAESLRGARHATDTGRD